MTNEEAHEFHLSTGDKTIELAQSIAEDVKERASWEGYSLEDALEESLMEFYGDLKNLIFPLVRALLQQ